MNFTAYIFKKCRKLLLLLFNISHEFTALHMRTFGLIGKPLGHSFSKTYFTDKFEKEGITDASYELFPLEKIEELKALLASNPNICGLNVTKPYKQQVIKYLDDIDMKAEIVGAVNTIQIQDGKLKGYNTDIYGFELSMKRWVKALKIKGGPKEAFILGTGGAAKAVANVLLRWGLIVWNVSRTPMLATHIPYEMIPSMIRPRKKLLIVNATPIGTAPEVDAMPDIPIELLTKHHMVFDLVYNPEESKLLQMAAKQGCPTKNGLEMLHLQADKAWKIWND